MNCAWIRPFCKKKMYCPWLCNAPKFAQAMFLLSSNDAEIKLVCLGDCKVGKSRFVQHILAPHSEQYGDYKETIEFSQIAKISEYKTLICEVGGNVYNNYTEEYVFAHGIIICRQKNSLLSDSHFAVILYDITIPETFNLTTKYDIALVI